MTNNSTSRYPRDMKKYAYKQGLYSHVHDSFIYNGPKLETTQLSVNRWIDKQIHTMECVRVCVCVCVCVRVCWSLSCFWLFVTPWTITHQAPLSIEFSRQEYWSGLPFPSPGGCQDPGIEPGWPSLQSDSLLFESPEKSYNGIIFSN